MPFREPEDRREYMKAYYRANREKHIAASKAWRAAHPDQARASNRRWYETKGKEYRATNRERVREQQRRWEQAHPEKARADNRVAVLRKYGLTEVDYAAMLAAQGDVCACCGKPEFRRGRNGEVKRLSVDHDHVTGSVRALLCHSCNTGIGSFYDDPALLRAAAGYIERYRPMGSGQ